MKVLHLWKSDSAKSGGGGAGAMFRLHSGLRAVGIDSKILCQYKTTESPHVSTLQHFPELEKLENILRPLTSRLGLNDIHRVSSFKLKQHEAYINADIIQFHGLHGGFINYLALPSLTESKPAVFTLCDMWALTGHCGFSFDCDRWKIGCGKCPYPDAGPSIKRDSTRIEWQLKNWVYSRSNLSIVSKSKWLTEMAKQSMLSRYPIYEIPNGIDTEMYQPLNREKCRVELGLPLDKKVLMFAAVKLDQYRKGGDLLLKALQSLPASLKAETVLLTLGLGGEAIAEAVGMPTLNLGFVSDDRRKAICYSAADLFLFPTRAENCPNVTLESIACGTPVVSFKVGGVPDQVQPSITGYLAEPENSKDFCEGIAQLLEDEFLRHQMSQQCRVHALENFNLELCIQRYIDLYQMLVG